MFHRSVQGAASPYTSALITARFRGGQALNRRVSLSCRKYVVSTVQPISRTRSTAYPNLRILGGAFLALSITGVGLVFYDGYQDEEDRREDILLKEMKLGTLLRSYFVFSYCSFPALVDAGPALIDLMNRYPVLKSTIEPALRRTFFAQFHPGENAEQVLPVLKSLHEKGIGALVAYNVEPLHDAPADYTPDTQADVEETINSVDTAASFSSSSETASGAADSRTWVSLKISGLTPDPALIERRASYLQRLRNHQGVGDGAGPGIVSDGDWERLWAIDKQDGYQSLRDVVALDELYENLKAIMVRAKQQGVTVYIDAEQTWYQPVIDVMQEALMKEFNPPDARPTVCGTFQAYLRRNSDYLETQLARSRARGYSLGLKLVRGAYHDAELEAWRAGGRIGPCPVYEEREGTDASYHQGVSSVLDALQEKVATKSSPEILALFGTHNKDTVEKVCKAAQEKDMASSSANTKNITFRSDVGKRVAFGQLYGMNDGLTSWIATSVRSESAEPMVIKVLPYGSLEQCLPWMARRAIDQKPLLQGQYGAVSERRRIAGELGRRMTFR